MGLYLLNLKSLPVCLKVPFLGLSYSSPIYIWHWLPLLSLATLTLYIDDIPLSQEIFSPTPTIQSNINLITLWISSHHLTINSKKQINDHLTQVFFFNHPPSFFLNISQLECVNSFKHLGVIITSALSWSFHI